MELILKTIWKEALKKRVRNNWFRVTLSLQSPCRVWVYRSHRLPSVDFQWWCCQGRPWWYKQKLLGLLGWLTGCVLEEPQSWAPPMLLAPCSPSHAPHQQRFYIFLHTCCELCQYATSIPFAQRQLSVGTLSYVWHGCVTHRGNKYRQTALELAEESDSFRRRDGRYSIFLFYYAFVCTGHNSTWGTYLVSTFISRRASGYKKIIFFSQCDVTQSSAITHMHLAYSLKSNLDYNRTLLSYLNIAQYNTTGCSATLQILSSSMCSQASHRWLRIRSQGNLKANIVLQSGTYFTLRPVMLPPNVPRTFCHPTSSIHF